MFRARFPIVHDKLLQLLNYLIVVFAFLMPINPWLGKKVVGPMIVLWALTVDYKKLLHELLHNRVLAVMTLFVLYVTLTLLWSEDQQKGTDYIRAFYKYFYIVFLIVLTSLEQKYIKWVLTAFLGAMLINVFLSLGFRFDLLHGLFGYAFKGKVIDPVPFQTSHMEYSVYIAFSFFLTLYAIFHSKTPARIIFFATFTILLLCVLFILQGRTGQVVFIGIGLILTLIYFKHSLRYLAGAFVLTAVIVVSAYTMSTTFHKQVNRTLTNVTKTIQHNDYQSSLGVRLASYVILPELLSENSILWGTGLGDAEKVVHRKHMRRFKTEGKNLFKRQRGRLQNTFITLWVATGLIGLALFVYLCYLLYRLPIRHHAMHYLQHTLLLTIILSSFSEMMFQQREIMYLMALFGALLVIQSKSERDTAI